MKKIQKMVGMAALSAAVLTSCVKNEETDGVKSLRDAQAGYLNAQSEQVLANVKNTLTLVSNQHLKNKQLEYQFKRDSLSYVIWEASKTANEEVSQLTIANAKLALEQEAILYQKNILGYQADLQAKQASLQTAIMQASIDKQSRLLTYTNQYELVLADILTLQKAIADKQYAIDVLKTIENNKDVSAQLYSILIIAKEKSIADENIALAENQKLLKTVNVIKDSYDANVNNASFTTIVAAYTTAKDDVLKKWSAYETQTKAVADAKKADDLAALNLAAKPGDAELQAAKVVTDKALTDATTLQTRIFNEYKVLVTYATSLETIVERINVEGNINSGDIIEDYQNLGVKFFATEIAKINDLIAKNNANIKQYTADIDDYKAGRTKDAAYVTAMEAEVASLNTLLADYKTQAAELYKLIEVSAE